MSPPAGPARDLDALALGGVTQSAVYLGTQPFADALALLVEPAAVAEVDLEYQQLQLSERRRRGRRRARILTRSVSEVAALARLPATCGSGSESSTPPGATP